MKTLLILSLVILSSCATKPPYQKMGQNGIHRVGYDEAKLTNNKYRLKYLDVDSIITYQRFMRRASELTLENNYQYFSITDINNKKENSMNIGIGYGGSMDMALPQYEATIVFEKEKSKDSIDAKEFLDTHKETIAKENDQTKKKKEAMDREMKKASGSI